MTWKYISGDKYTLDQLHEIRVFFEDDFDSAREEIKKALRYEKYGLPNWRTEILRREMGLEESIRNLNTINRAILEWKP